MAHQIPVQCEMCCKKQAVGCCNMCGNMSESCLEIHKKGRAFQPHNLKIYEKDGYNPGRIMYDITEEMCIRHPIERASLFCKKGDSMICGRCLHSDHLSCGNEVVDFCQELRQFDNEQTNAMTAALNEIKDESKRMKKEVDGQKEKKNVIHMRLDAKQNWMIWKKKLKLKVEHAINSVRKEVHTFNGENIKAFSCISFVCEEKVSWAINEEGKLNEFVNKSFTGRLYLMSRNFEKEISKAKNEMKEAHYKNTFKSVLLKENTAAFKCLIEDLTDVCELQEEVDGSDDGTTLSIGNATVENQKKYNPTPEKPYNGAQFSGCLKVDNEGQLVCRMLKATFRRGLMFTVNEVDDVGLDGKLLYDRPGGVITRLKTMLLGYGVYIQMVKEDLAAKGITEANIDLTEELEETFTVDGP